MEENGKKTNKQQKKPQKNQSHKKDLQWVCNFFQMLWTSHEALSDPTQLIKVPKALSLTESSAQLAWFWQSSYALKHSKMPQAQGNIKLESTISYPASCHPRKEGIKPQLPLAAGFWVVFKF